jgi:hypothetical protein
MILKIASGSQIESIYKAGAPLWWAFFISSPLAIFIGVDIIENYHSKLAKYERG